MSSVLIRVDPKTKTILDNMKGGKKVQGKGYYSRQMKYDDLILNLIDNQKYVSVVDFVHSFFEGFSYDRYNTDVVKITRSFVRYLKGIILTFDRTEDIDTCQKVIDSLTSILDNE